MNVLRWIWGFFVSPLLVDIGFSRQIGDGKEHGFVTVKTSQRDVKLPFIAWQKDRLRKPNRTIVKGILAQARKLELNPKSVVIKLPDGYAIYNNKAVRQR